MRVSPQEAINFLLNGAVVALPTETVYGLAACIHSRSAIEKIYSLKKRPLNNPLIVHLADPADLRDFIVETPPNLKELMDRFFPGPLSIIVSIDTDKIPSIARSGLSTAAFRVPTHPIVRSIIRTTGPLVMPSANLSGKPSATDPEAVECDFGKDFPVVDGGETQEGLESTVLAFKEGRWWIARLGAITPAEFAETLGYVPLNWTTSRGMTSPISPGQLFKHYSPNALLKLVEQPMELEGIVVGFSDRRYPRASSVYYLGSLKNPNGVAANLYRILRKLDQDQVQEAVIDMDMPYTGLWSTIRDRLEKAADS